MPKPEGTVLCFWYWRLGCSERFGGEAAIEFIDTVIQVGSKQFRSLLTDSQSDYLGACQALIQMLGPGHPLVGVRFGLKGPNE